MREANGQYSSPRIKPVSLELWHSRWKLPLPAENGKDQLLGDSRMFVIDADGKPFEVSMSLMAEGAKRYAIAPLDFDPPFLALQDSPDLFALVRDYHIETLNNGERKVNSIPQFLEFLAKEIGETSA
jgi:hypothetical protein